MKYYIVFWTVFLMVCLTTATSGAQEAAVIGFSAQGETSLTCRGLNDNGDPRKFTLWLVNAVNPSFGTTGARDVRHVSGFELKIDKALGVNIIGIEYAIAATNSGTDQDYIIQYAVPQSVYANQTLILAEFQLAQAPDGVWPHDCESEENYFLIGPADGATLPGEVSIIDGDDPLEPFVIATPGTSLLLTGYVTVANEISTWGSVKSLYR